MSGTLVSVTTSGSIEVRFSDAGREATVHLAGISNPKDRKARAAIGRFIRDKVGNEPVIVLMPSDWTFASARPREVIATVTLKTGFDLGQFRAFIGVQIRRRLPQPQVATRTAGRSRPPMFPTLSLQTLHRDEGFAAMAAIEPIKELFEGFIAQHSRDNIVYADVREEELAIILARSLFPSLID
jgi:hypothetical protein